MSTPTLGSQRLKKLLTPAMSQAELARSLGVTPQAVSQWVTGKAAPDRKNAAALEKLAGIPMSSWTESQEAPPLSAA